MKEIQFLGFRSRQMPRTIDLFSFFFFFDFHDFFAFSFDVFICCRGIFHQQTNQILSGPEKSRLQRFICFLFLTVLFIWLPFYLNEGDGLRLGRYLF